MRFEQPLKRYVQEGDHVLIVGAGLAGALVAYYLSKQNVRLTVIDVYCTPGAGASALYAGLIHPHWQKDDSPLFQLTRLGFIEMVRLLKQFPHCFDQLGVLDIAQSDQEFEAWTAAFQKNIPQAFDSDFLTLVDAERARAISGYELIRGGWYFEQAGQVYCSSLVRALLVASQAQIISNVKVSLSQQDQTWMAQDEHGTVWAQADHVVVCAALGSAQAVGLQPIDLGLQSLKGRISLLPVGALEGTVPTTGHGYLMKAEGFEAVGATYERADKPITAEQAHEHNMQTFQILMNQDRQIVNAGFYEGVRAVPKDRMPLMGAAFLKETVSSLSFKGRPELKFIPRDSGLWMLAGLGSRGLTWGAILAQELVELMCAREGRLGKRFHQRLDPARFLFDRGAICEIHK